MALQIWDTTWFAYEIRLSLWALTPVMLNRSHMSHQEMRLCMTAKQTLIYVIWLHMKHAQLKPTCVCSALIDKRGNQPHYATCSSSPGSDLARVHLPNSLPGLVSNIFLLLGFHSDCSLWICITETADRNRGSIYGPNWQTTWVKMRETKQLNRGLPPSMVIDPL